MGKKIRLNICLLFKARYSLNMRVDPQIGIISYLTKFGHNITWIINSEKNCEIQKTKIGDSRVIILPNKPIIGYLNLIAEVLFRLRKKRFLFKHFMMEKYDFVIVRDGLLDGFFALLLRRKYGCRFILHLSNPLEQEWEAHRRYSNNKLFWYFVTKIKTIFMIYLLNNADLVLPTSKYCVEDFNKKGIKKSKMMAHPSGIDRNIFSTSDNQIVKKKYNLTNFKVIVYVGTLHKMRHLHVLIQAFSRVKQIEKNVVLLMIGDGNDKLNLEKLASDLGIRKSIIFIKHVNFSNIPNYIASADIGVSPVPPIECYKVSSPIKLLEYLSMGKPVIANHEIYEHKEVIEKSGGGILVSFSDNGFAEGLIELLKKPEEAKKMGKKGKKWILNNRTYHLLARRFEKRCFELLEYY